MGRFTFGLYTLHKKKPRKQRLACGAKHRNGRRVVKRLQVHHMRNAQHCVPDNE
jgi:hypothetical protein